MIFGDVIELNADGGGKDLEYLPPPSSSGGSPTVANISPDGQKKILHYLGEDLESPPPPSSSF
jgi:hypothetical protein